MLHGIAHAGFEVHGYGVLSLDAGQGSNGHHQNEKGMFSFHLTHNFLRAKRKHTACQKCNYLKFKDLKFKDLPQL
jgi:hypothetical protein